MNPGWDAIPTPEGSQVVPVGDLIEHVIDGDCPCGPATEHLTAADGRDAWMTVHHSLDGREANEQ